jgi:hypothetical protein
MLNPVLLIPAYGKTYATKEELIAGWESGKEFKFWAGPGCYCSIRDLKELSYLASTITITDLHGKFNAVVWSYIDNL